MKLAKGLVVGATVVLLTQVAVAGDDSAESPCQYSTQECLDYMASKMKDSGWVGVELEGGEVGMTVTAVVAGSPAEESGMQVGDVLVAINDIELIEENEEKLSQARREWKPGSAVTWTMARDSSERDLDITLARMPADVLARWIGAHMLEHAEVEVAAAE